MGLLRDKKYTPLCKGFFLVVYLILLGGQLSHKFYLYANSPTQLFKVYVWEISHQQTSANKGSSLLNDKIFPSLSLDKRYELKHLFSILPPEFCLRHPYHEKQMQACARRGHCIRIYPLLQALRGPPSAV